MVKTHITASKPMKTFILSVFFYCMIIQAQAQQHSPVKLWPGQVPLETKPKGVEKETFDNGLLRITEVTDPLIEVYLAPVKSAKPTPAVVVCPGGGYSILALELEGREIAVWLNSQGISAFVLHYRVPMKKDGALQDAARAMRIIRSKAAAYNINVEQVGIMGFSAGGSLSARLNSRFAEPLYQAVDKADELSAKPNFCILIYPAYLDAGANNTLTPELKLNSTSAPFFIFQTSDDQYGNSALVMASALRNEKLPVELHFYATGGHGYGLRPGNEAAQAWPVLLSTWLNGHVLK